jgi:hypothetical protein
VAVTVTLAGFGTVAGAVYTPIFEIVPPPVTLQVTAWLFVPVTVAVKVNVLPTATVLCGAVTITLTRLDGGAVLLLPEQPLKNKTIGKKDSPVAARVMDVP